MVVVYVRYMGVFASETAVLCSHLRRDERVCELVLVREHLLVEVLAAEDDLDRALQSRRGGRG